MPHMITESVRQCRI